MLYKKNSALTLSTELFENPPAEYRCTPFWAWTGPLDKDQLCRQIEHMKQMGMGGFHMHPRTGLDTEYLSDEFMEAVKACCDKAEAEQMLAWLYDEDRWSSGPAGGLVTKHCPFRRKRLTVFPEDKGYDTPKEKALESGEPYLLACYDVQLDKDGYLVSSRRISKEECAEGTKWYAYVVNEKESSWFNGQTYLDAMDEEAVAEFIRVTHERYNEVIGDRFDKSVPAIFTDEPNANHEKTITIPAPDYLGRILYGWSRYFEEAFQAYYGWDLLDRLPELFWITRDREDSYVKYCYFDFVAHQFSKNFSKQIGAWCDEHGIALTGHLLREPSLMEQAITCGETMRNYGDFGIPGIDMLCDAVELTTAKQTQSAVHQYGKEGMLSELYGVTNWDFDFRGHKFQGDWQAALGVTVRVPHLTWQSMAGEAKRDYPAAIGYQSPWYKEYPFIEDHFARVNTALTRGRPIVSLGVIHPVESVWISAGPNSQLANQVQALENGFESISRWLLEDHLDYDYICESQLPKLSDENDPCRVGKMRYDAILIPGCLSLRRSTLEYLEKFQKAGGKVVFVGSCPGYVDGVKNDGCRDMFEKSTCVGFDKAEISEALEAVRNVGIRLADGKNADDLIYNYRQDGENRWLFVVHLKKYFRSTSHGEGYQYDVVDPAQVTLTLKGEFAVTEYNTLTGEISPMACTYENGNTLISRELYALDSLLLQLTPGRGETAARKEKEGVFVRTYDIKHGVDYSCSEPNVLLLDLAEYAFDDGAWQEKEDVFRIDNQFRDLLDYPRRDGKLAQPYTMKKEQETHVLHLRYTFKSELTVSGAMLALEDAEKVTVRLNGQTVSRDILGYFTDESIKTIALPEIRAGENVLTLDIPFGKRTNVEWIYVLGQFGVRLCGCDATLVPQQKKLGFGDVTAQGMPFYGANITYSMKVEMPEAGALQIHAPYYRGSLIGVSLDGKREGSIVLPPYTCVIENVSAGEHTLELTVFGNRHNSFAALHLIDSSQRWFGPAAWRTEGDDWCYEYRVKPFGILKSPVITLLK